LDPSVCRVAIFRLSTIIAQSPKFRLRHAYRASVDYTVDDDERVVEEFGGQLVSAYHRGDSGVAGLRGVVEAVGRGSGKQSPTDLPYTG